MDLKLTALRFRLHTAKPLGVPDAKYTNVVRGALGLRFREQSCLPDCQDPSQCPKPRQCQYTQFFAPENAPDSGPSGLASTPRPFILRVQPTPAGLDVGLHLFGPPEDLVPPFATAMLHLCAKGLGPGRVPATLTHLDSLDANGSPSPFQLHAAYLPPQIILPLTPDANPPSRIRVHFLTPTELKHDGGITRNAHFAALFARIRDRVLFLASKYGTGPAQSHSSLALDLARHADAITCTAESLQVISLTRKSTRTGQEHQIGGFTGHADYTGDFSHLWPWLKAAEWTGVGRQTVWGKGHILCEPLAAGY